MPSVVAGMICCVSQQLKKIYIRQMDCKVMLCLTEGREAHDVHAMYAHRVWAWAVGAGE